MPNAALLLAPIVPVPERLPDEPHRTTPYEQAISDYNPRNSEQPWPQEEDYPDPFGHQPPRNATLRNLLGYRTTTFKPVKRARGVGFLAYSAKPDAFDLGRQRGDELTKLYDIAHAYGGDHLVLWTFGQAVHLWAARSVAPGARPLVLQISVRIDAPRDVGRPGGMAERIAQWLEGSPLAPDVNALRRALEAPVLSVPAWFAAFGVPGAKDLEPPPVGAGWDAFEQVADALLRGDAPDAALRKRVNALIDDADAHLPGKPAKKRGAVARRVAEAFVALREALGEPTSPRLAACASAAELYDRITSGPARDRLLQTTRKPLAVSLALGRLLAHYPVEVRRDRIFLALAAFDAEVWNGHSFVGPLEELAERSGGAGFTLAIVPEAHEADFRQSHGTRADESAARGGWAGEAAIDAGGVGEETVASFTHWFARSGVDGAVVRCEASGACRVLRFVAGQVVEDAPSSNTALADAARALDPRGAILAAGFPDVLAPGTLAEEVRHTEDDGEPVVPRAMLSARLDAGGMAPVTSLLDYPWPRRDERVSLLVRLTSRDESYVAALARDVRHLRGMDVRPTASRSGTELWGHSADMEGGADWLARMLGDLPTGSAVAFAHGESLALLQIAPEVASAQPPAAAPAPSPDWVPPQVVLETKDNLYATADLARLAWGRDEGVQLAQQLAQRYPGRVSATEPIAATDALALLDEALRALGFVRLGDLLASHLYGFAVRAYTHADGVSTAIVIVAPMRPLIECEIQTQLADGTEVTTSSLDIGATPRPGASVRRASLGVDALWQAHEKHLAKVRRGRALKPAPTTLADFARLLET